MRVAAGGGDFTSSINQFLSFRIFIQDPGETYFGGTQDIRLISGGGTILTSDLTQDPYGQTAPTDLDNDYNIDHQLIDSNFTGTPAQFAAVMADLEFIDIRGEFWLGPNRNTRE